MCRTADFEILTLLFQRVGQPGLEVCPGKTTTRATVKSEGTWIPMDPKPGCITCELPCSCYSTLLWEQQHGVWLSKKAYCTLTKTGRAQHGLNAVRHVAYPPVCDHQASAPSQSHGAMASGASKTTRPSLFMVMGRLVSFLARQSWQQLEQQKAEYSLD